MHGKTSPRVGADLETFLRNHVAGTGAIDFLVVPTINFRLLFVLVLLRQKRRCLISLSVTDHPRADWIARHITEAFLRAVGAQSDATFVWRTANAKHQTLPRRNRR
jgi:hypothetical protein